VIHPNQNGSFATSTFLLPEPVGHFTFISHVFDRSNVLVSTAFSCTSYRQNW